ASDSGATSDAGCTGRHPLLDGSVRFCNGGDCYCSNPDSCLPQATAAKCCSVAVICGGVECRGNHPLVDGGARVCAPGACYCSANDACFPAASAATCCATTPTCY